MDTSIITIPQKLVQLHETRDPFQLAQNLGCYVRFIDTKRQKGFCQILLNSPYIFINQNMSPQMQRMTCAHELGHLVLHRAELKKKKRFAEMELFDITDHLELEANQFAANLLIGDEELLELLKSGYDIVETAAQFHVNVNMLMVKLLSMKKIGYEFDLPYYPDARFMGKINGEAGEACDE